MRVWKTEMHIIVPGADGTPSDSASYQSYTLMQAKAVINRIRKEEQLAGLPRRKLAPVSRYLLEELIQRYFKNYSQRGGILVDIKIEDRKQYGI